MILLPSFVAGSNAFLLTGDPAYFDLYRSQLDQLWSLRREEDGVIQIPHRHGAQGWFDYRPPEPGYLVYLYYLTRDAADLRRIQQWTRLPAGWDAYPRFGKRKASFRPEPWFAYIMGEHPDFPNAVLDDTHATMCWKLDQIDADDGDAEARDLNYWTLCNPVIPEGILQMATGSPAAVYLGGLLHADVRYFDPQARRAGLPPDVAALVSESAAERITLTLVNLDPLRERAVVLQAGSFGEHEFIQGTAAWGEQTESVDVYGKHVRVELAPGAQVQLRLGVRRNVHRPSYEFPPL
jgi:hypothetical protein